MVLGIRVSIILSFIIFSLMSTFPPPPLSFLVLRWHFPTDGPATIFLLVRYVYEWSISLLFFFMLFLFHPAHKQEKIMQEAVTSV